MVTMTSNNTSSSVRLISFSRLRKYTFLQYIFVTSAVFLFSIFVIVFRVDSNNNDFPISTIVKQSSSFRIGNRRMDAIISNDIYSDDQCRFYLAESAIPQGGLGLFTTIDIAQGNEAQSMADICIYVADTPDCTAFHTHSWAKDTFLGQFEGWKPRAACEGFATLFNSMPEGVSTSTLVSHHHHTNGGLRRDHDPGAGAISQYYGITSTANRNIKAGQELTIDYGDWDYEEHKKYQPPYRQVEWIRQHGMCIDHIEIRNATDRTMGRGAFAKRHLSKGAIVAPAPMQFFKNRQIFAKQIPEALFVNYCFQPSGLDMLLYPYGPGVNLINHASGNKANVKIAWSNHSMSHATWLDLPIQQFWEMQYPGALILDIIALRNIPPGEELFLDYGKDWEMAWNQHVQKWKPLLNASEYHYVQDFDRTQPFRTIQEQKKNPYPTHMKTICWTANWHREDYTRMIWTKPNYYPEGYLYCNILSRQWNQTTSGYEYEVSLLFDRMQPDVKKDELLYIDTNVPHSAISIVHKPYMSDLHLTTAFRQPITFPSHLIPKHWFPQNVKVAL
jgi:SET domain